MHSQRNGSSTSYDRLRCNFAEVLGQLVFFADARIHNSGAGGNVHPSSMEDEVKEGGGGVRKQLATYFSSMR